MSSPVIVSSVFDLQKSCTIRCLFGIQTNIPTRDCIDFIRLLRCAPAKCTLTAKCVGWATVQQRRRFNCFVPCDPDILPGTADVGALGGPQGTGPEKGYLWDAALRAGLTIRKVFEDRQPAEPGIRAADA